MLCSRCSEHVQGVVQGTQQVSVTPREYGLLLSSSALGAAGGA